MVKYKQIFVLFILIIFSFTLVSTTPLRAEPPTQPKDRLQEIIERGVLNVASSNDTPFSYIDTKTNKFTGIDADILTEAARRLGINKVELKYIIPFNDLLTELNKNTDIDIVADAMYITDERKKIVLFTDPWYKESEAIVTPMISKIVIKDNLKNAAVGAQNGTAFLELAEKWKNEGVIKAVKVYNSQNELLSAVNKAEIDAAITDSISALYEISNNKSLYLTTLSNQVYKPEIPGVIGAAVRTSDTSLVNSLNKKINEMKQDGTVLEILKKYGLDENFYIPYTFSYPID